MVMKIVADFFVSN